MEPRVDMASQMLRQPSRVEHIMSNQIIIVRLAILNDTDELPRCHLIQKSQDRGEPSPPFQQLFPQLKNARNPERLSYGGESLGFQVLPESSEIRGQREIINVKSTLCCQTRIVSSKMYSNSNRIGRNIRSNRGQ